MQVRGFAYHAAFPSIYWCPINVCRCIATNITSYEALVQSHCNWAAKTYAIIV